MAWYSSRRPFLQTLASTRNALIPYGLFFHQSQSQGIHRGFFKRTAKSIRNDVWALVTGDECIFACAEYVFNSYVDNTNPNAMPTTTASCFSNDQIVISTTQAGAWDCRTARCRQTALIQPGQQSCVFGGTHAFLLPLLLAPVCLLFE